MQNLSFPRSSRLLNAGDYRFVFNGAVVKVSDKHLLVLARPNTRAQPRLGLVIAKKHVRLATQRNRVKRLIRESYRQQQQQLPSLDLVVLARPGLASLDNPALAELLQRTWQRLRKYHQRFVQQSSQKAR